MFLALAVSFLHKLFSGQPPSGGLCQLKRTSRALVPPFTAMWGSACSPDLKWQGYRILILNDIHATDEENSQTVHFHVNITPV